LPQFIEEQIQVMEENADGWDEEAVNWNMPKLHDIASFLRDRRQAFKMWGIDALQFDIEDTHNPNKIGLKFTMRDVREDKEEEKR
jgi:hypothetical protein